MMGSVLRPTALGGLRREGTWRVGVVIVAVLGAAAVPSVPADAYGVESWMAQGAAYYRSGALAEAERAFSRAAAASPSEARPALWMGAVEVARGHRATAAAWFAEALRRRPTAAEQGCATVWLNLLGIEVNRPRWRVRTIDEYGAFVRAVNPQLSTGQSRWLGAAVLEASARYRLDPRLLAAVVYIESRFNHQSISAAGAEGLGQLMPGTAEGLGVDPRDPLQNLFGAAWLLRLNLDEFHNLPLALAAYNAGSGAVRRWNVIPPYAETQWYVWAVLWVYDGLRA
jgi:soluble lytic murein transglycosylase-like protein